MAARLRPREVDTYQILHQAAGTVRAKKEAVRRANEEEEMRDCTFAPLLNTNRWGRGAAAQCSQQMRQGTAGAQKSPGSVATRSCT